MGNDVELEFETLEKAFSKDPEQEKAPIEIEAEPEEIEEPKAEETPEEVINEQSKAADIEDVLAASRKNYAEYAKNFPNYKGLEDFLSSLPAEWVRDIRKYAVENEIYGNQPLEQMLIHQFGVLLQVRDVKRVSESFEWQMKRVLDRKLSEMEKILEAKKEEMTKALEAKVADMNSKEKEWAEMAANVGKSIEGVENKYEVYKMKELNKIKETLEEEKKVLLSTLRNDLLNGIKRDVNSISKNVKEGSTAAFKEMREEAKAFNTMKLFFVVLAGNAITAAVTIFLMKLL